MVIHPDFRGSVIEAVSIVLFKFLQLFQWFRFSVSVVSFPRFHCLVPVFQWFWRFRWFRFVSVFWVLVHAARQWFQTDEPTSHLRETSESNDEPTSHLRDFKSGSVFCSLALVFFPMLKRPCIRNNLLTTYVQSLVGEISDFSLYVLTERYQGLGPIFPVITSLAGNNIGNLVSLIFS